jgi:hypothetical protein
MLDLFAGTGGASAAMRARGWSVTRVEMDPAFSAEVIGDVRSFCWTGPAVDLVWASPPCLEFSRSFLPWIRSPAPPSMDLVEAAIRVIRDVRPRWWVIENVKGAARWFRPHLGPPLAIFGPVWLWGNLPPWVWVPSGPLKWKERLNSRRRVDRAAIPWAVSQAVALAVEAGARCELDK